MVPRPSVAAFASGRSARDRHHLLGLAQMALDNRNWPTLNRALMAWFFRYVSRTPADPADPRINLVGANLAGLPPSPPPQAGERG